MIRSILSLALITVLASCANENGADAASAAATTQPDAATAAAPATDDTADAPAGAGAIHVEITGGEHAGTYDIANTDGCSYGLAEKGAWGNQFSRDSDDARQLNSVQLIVPDAAAAEAGTDKFLITVSFGPQFGAGKTDYTVDTRAKEPQGSGTVTVDDRGQAGTVTFDVTTPDDVRMQGTIECNGVLRA